MKLETEVTAICNEICSKYNPEEVTLETVKIMIDDIFVKIRREAEHIEEEKIQFDIFGVPYSFTSKVFLIMRHFANNFCICDFVRSYGTVVREAFIAELKKTAKQVGKKKFKDVKYIDENHDFSAVYGKGKKLNRIELAKKYIEFLEDQYESIEEGEVYELSTKLLLENHVTSSQEKRYQDIQKLTDMGLIYRVSLDIPLFLCQQFIVNVQKVEELRSLTI